MNDLEAHERECAVRYKNIEERLDRGTERMNRIEMSVYALYPFLVGLLIASKFLGQTLMFAELAAITSAISAINNTIATFKEGKANAQDAAALLGKFSNTAQKLDDWEKKKKLKRPLTPKEAMDLSIKRREIKAVETKIKDHLMMMGMSSVWLSLIHI